MLADVRDNHYSPSICESRSEPSIACKVDTCQTGSGERAAKQEKLNKDGQKGDFMTDELVIFKTKEKKDMVIITDGNSCHTSSTSGDKGIITNSILALLAHLIIISQAITHIFPGKYCIKFSCILWSKGTSIFFP
jgi:hypothetical protein